MVCARFPVRNGNIICNASNLMTVNTKLREYNDECVVCMCQAYEDFWIWARHLNFQACMRRIKDADRYTTKSSYL